jgi:hypothetical protein
VLGSGKNGAVLADVVGLVDTMEVGEVVEECGEADVPEAARIALSGTGGEDMSASAS